MTLLKTSKLRGLNVIVPNYHIYFPLFSWPRAEVTNHTWLMPNLSAEIDTHTHYYYHVFIEVTDYT